MELLALISTHRRPPAPPGATTPDGRLITGATLIITPIAILQQWIDEIQQHTPHLTYFVFNPGKNDRSLRPQELAPYDVVLMSYERCRTELPLARPDHGRSRRFERQYERPKSVLVELEFWRVCVDEAQMVRPFFFRCRGTYA